MEITQQQTDTLKLIERTTKDSNGWRKCSPVIFKELIISMPQSLVEIRGNDDARQVRLTDEAEVVLKWM